MTNKDQSFLESIITELVDYPAIVKVERTTDEMGVLLTVHLHQEDIGRVIGRQGETAKALRAILRVYGMKNGARINIKIAEPGLTG